MVSLLILFSTVFGFDNQQIQKAFYSTVLLQLPGDNHCTGVLVNENHVLTASHCILTKGRPFDLSAITVHLHILDKSKSNKIFLTDSIQKIKFHPQFNSRHSQVDLVILKLKNPIPHKLDQARIHFNLNNYNENYHSSALLMGYGISAKAKVDLKQYKKELVYPKIRGKLFDLNTAENQNDQLILDNQIAQACVGDSGGPLMAVTDDGQIQLIGLAIAVKISERRLKREQILLNKVQHCTSQALFLKLPLHRDWILEEIK